VSLAVDAMTQADRRYPEITDDELNRAESLTGVILRRPRNRTVASADTLIGYARAIGSRIPLYTDVAQGLRTYWGALVGHPTSLYCFDDTMVAPALPGIQSIYAGCRWQWELPLRLGTEVTTQAVVEKVERRTGSFAGSMVLQSGRVEYRDENGRLLATARPRVLRTPRDAARARGKYAGIEVYRYSPAELDAIIEAYQAEEIRGDRPLYWEDVAIGDKLPGLVKGPVTTEDMGMFVGATRQTLFFGDFLDHWRRHPADAYWSPDTRSPDWWDASLLRDEVAQEFGFPLAHDTGSQRIAWIENCVSNWAGDFSFLRALDVTLRRPCFRGDTTWVRGSVTGKRRTGRAPSERFEITCDLTAVDQRGETTATAQAVVQVVSKEVDTIPPVLRLPDDYDPFRGLPR
jgi:N-terminal half of MaoC dehydratase